MGQPHKHAELIKLWADGAEIQVKDNPDLLLLACDYLLDFQELSSIIHEGVVSSIS